MKILDVNKRICYDSYEKSNIASSKDSYIVLCTKYESEFIKDIINNKKTDHLSYVNFSNYVKIESTSDFDAANIKTMEYINHKIIDGEVDLYMSDNIIAISTSTNNFMYKFMEKLIKRSKVSKYKTDAIMYLASQYIIREFIINGFEFVEELEKNIILLEEDIMNNTADNSINKIHSFIIVANKVVKNLNPLMCMVNGISSNSDRYIKDKDLYHYENGDISRINSDMNRLYKISTETNDLANRLLEFHMSNLNEGKTPTITKVAILTVIVAIITVALGVVRLLFGFTPNLKFSYGFPAALLMFIVIAVAGTYIFKKNNLL